MKACPLSPLALAIVLAGCAASDLPVGARLVGGGLWVNYEAPADGTAILIERTSRRIVATESLSEGNSFQFGPGSHRYDEVLFRMFAPAEGMNPSDVIVLPTNTFFELYFVPRKSK